jgi:hypothetical protein
VIVAPVVVIFAPTTSNGDEVPVIVPVATRVLEQVIVPVQRAVPVTVKVFVPVLMLGEAPNVIDVEAATVHAALTVVTTCKTLVRASPVSVRIDD